MAVYEWDGTPSTIFEPRLDKISRPPKAQARNAAEGRHWALLPWRDRRKPLQMTVKYRGGSELWYEVHARGGVLRLQGYVSVHDLMEYLNCARRDRPGGQSQYPVK